MADKSETWSSDPGFIYPPHGHDYLKKLVCLKGSIVFTMHLSKGERYVQMEAGDMLEIPPRTIHSAVVGPQGVTCSETHLRDMGAKPPAL